MMNTRQIIAELRPTGFGRRRIILSHTEKDLMLALENTSIPKDSGMSTVSKRDGGQSNVRET